jgi:hypothetical protein
MMRDPVLPVHLKHVTLIFLYSSKMKFTLLLALTASSVAQAAQLAFPGAGGFGRFAVGGRQGEVYKVTNLK